MSILFPFASLSTEEHERVRARLDEYYATAKGYTAFENPSQQIHCWEHVLEVIQKMRSRGAPRVRVLEVGCGKSGFSEFLRSKSVREHVEYVVQDVTDYNRVFLSSEADEVIVGALEHYESNKKFDVIFSTYVLEHVSNPLLQLETLWCLLDVSGSLGTASLLLFSPRYDIPGLFPPSTRHLSTITKGKLLVTHIAARIKTILAKRPQFLIQTDLSVFHQPFFRDADALHWVSRYDIEAWGRSVGARMRWLPLPTGDLLKKQWVVRKFCTLSIELQKATQEVNK